MVKVLASVLCPLILNCPGSPLFGDGAITTPGVNWSSVLKLRPLSGKLATKFLSITVLTAADSVFTSGAPPVTVTITDVAPMGSVKLIAKASCTFRVTFGLIIVLNPLFDTWMRYGPGGRLGAT